MHSEYLCTHMQQESTPGNGNERHKASITQRLNVNLIKNREKTPHIPKSESLNLLFLYPVKIVHCLRISDLSHLQIWKVK